MFYVIFIPFFLVWALCYYIIAKFSGWKQESGFKKELAERGVFYEENRNHINFKHFETSLRNENLNLALRYADRLQNSNFNHIGKEWALVGGKFYKITEENLPYIEKELTRQKIKNL